MFCFSCSIVWFVCQIVYAQEIALCSREHIPWAMFMQCLLEFTVILPPRMAVECKRHQNTSKERKQNRKIRITRDRNTHTRPNKRGTTRPKRKKTTKSVFERKEKKIAEKRKNKCVFGNGYCYVYIIIRRSRLLARFARSLELATIVHTHIWAWVRAHFMEMTNDEHFQMACYKRVTHCIC